MPASQHLAIFIYFLAVFQVLEGFPGNNFVAEVSERRSYLGHASKIGHWSIQQIQGFRYNEGKGFQATVLGIYLVSYTVNIKRTGSSGMIRPSICINKVSHCQTLASEYNQASTTQRELSLHATGSIKLNAGDSVALRITSNIPWTLESKSTFFGYLLHEYGIVPAIYVHPSSEQRLITKRLPMIQTWEALKDEGSFISTQSFSRNLGVFSITTSGFYYVGVNVILRKYKGEDTFSLLLMNGNKKILHETYAANSNVHSATITVNTVLGLKSGTKLYIVIYKEGKSISSVHPISSFSVAMLHRTLEGLNGFSLKTLQTERYMNGSRINLKKFTHAITGHENKVLLDQTFPYRTGHYLVCFNFRVQCVKTPACSMSFYINKKLALPGVRGNAGYNCLSRCTSVFLRSGGLIDLKVYANSVQWLLGAGSTISIVLLQELLIAFNLGSAAVEEGNDSWIKVEEGKSSRYESKSFILADELKQGEYVVKKTGVYQINANVIFNNIRAATLSACIAINGNLKKTDGLFATDTSASGTQTLVISSAVYLQKGQHISLFVKVSGKSGWNLDSDTALSALYLGEKDLVIGLHTSFVNDVTHKSTGWQTCANWYQPNYIAYTPWSFASGLKSSPSGTFVIHVDGLYYISANIVLGKANLISDESLFIGIVTVNEEIGSELLFTRLSWKTSPTQFSSSSDVTLSISGALQLKKQDVVSVKICSKTDSIWTIRKQTAISIVLVSNSQNATGFLARSKISFKNDSNGNYRNWTYSGSDPKLFKAGKDLLLNGNEISIVQQGIYMLSISAQIRKETQGSVLLGVLDTRPDQKIFCAQKSQIYKEYFLSCNMLMHFMSGDRIKVFIEGLEKDSRFSVGSATLSMVEMVRSAKPPWFYAELQESFQLLEKMTLTNWRKYSSGRGIVLGHDGIQEWNEREQEKRISLGHVLITVNLLFDGISNGNHSVSLRESGTNVTSSTVYQFDSTKRFHNGVMSSSRILSLISNGLEITLDATGSFIDKKSSFSMAYLVSQPHLDILHLQLESSKIINSSGTLHIGEWKLANAKSKLSGVFIKKNVIYLLSIEVIAEFTSDIVQLSIHDEENSTLAAWVLMRHAISQSTYSMSRLFKTKVTGSFTVSIELESEAASFKLIKGSRVSLVPIGKESEVTGLIASLHQAQRKESSSIFRLLPNEIKFSNRIKYIQDTLIIRRTGIYFITVDVSVAIRGRATVEVFLLVNGDLGSSIYAWQEMRSNGTVSFANSLRFQRGTLLNLQVSISEGQSVEILPIAALGIVMLNDFDYEIDDRLLPVMYRSILPSAKRAEPIGHSLTLKCFVAADDKIYYKWFRNGSVVPSQKDTITLNGNLGESGEYYCEASAFNALAISEPVTIEFYDINECVEGNHGCIGRNQTCINVPGTYKCRCDGGLFMHKGECKAETPASDVRKRSGLLRSLPLAVIVLVPIAILVSIFVIAVLIYTCYMNKKSTIQRRILRRSGSFSEQISLHREDYNQHQFQHCRSDSDLSDAEQSTPMTRINRVSGPDIIRFSFPYDSDLDSTMDLRDEDFQSTSSV